MEIRCPDSCPYLASAREHPAAVERRQRELDFTAFFPVMDGLNARQTEILFTVLSAVRAFRPDALFRLSDDDVAEAAEAVAATLETAAKGLIYEHRPASLSAQRVASSIREALGRREDHASSSFERDAAFVLRRVQRGAHEARKLFAGDPTAFIGLVGRVTKPPTEADDRPTDDTRGPRAPAAGLIIP